MAAVMEHMVCLLTLLQAALVKLQDHPEAILVYLLVVVVACNVLVPVAILIGL